MRIGVFRAVDDGRRTAARLAGLGHEAILAPVLRIVATGATVQAGAADALVFTSAHAPEALASHPEGTAHLRHLPCWCVGAQTGAAARAAGFTQVATGAGNAMQLAETIAAKGGSQRLTFVAGRDRKPDLEIALTRGGLALEVVEAYAAEAIQQWPTAVIARLSDMEGAIHYSRRTVALTFHLAEMGGLAARFRAAAHYCLSQDIGAALIQQGVKQPRVATVPAEDSMLALMEGV